MVFRPSTAVSVTVDIFADGADHDTATPLGSATSTAHYTGSTYFNGEGFLLTFPDLEALDPSHQHSAGYKGWQPDRVRITYIQDIPVFGNIPGETGSTYSFAITSSIDVASSLDKSTTGAYSDTFFDTNINGYHLIAVRSLSGGDHRADWGLESSLTSSVIAVYATGANHATATPLIVLSAPHAATGGFYTGPFGIDLDVSEANIDTFESLAEQVGDDFSTSEKYAISDANYEVWQGTETVPLILSGTGLYRVVATSPSGTQVISNEIEIT